MEVLLYRWSTMAQLVSDTMIMIFLVVLYRSVRRPELRPHVWAWTANFVALSITVGYWVFRPEQYWLRKLVATLYVSMKMSFACLLIVGVAALSGRIVRGRRIGAVLLACLAYGIFVALTYQSINQLGVYNAAGSALLLWSAVALILREQPPAWSWLAAGFAVRAGFASVEALAYLSQLTSVAWLPPDLVEPYLAAHSSFDGAAEWMIALGCVLTMYRIIAAELAHSHQEMSAAKERMRELAESDMLTGLANRRTLMPALRAVRPQGASILFFDLNDFKQINDRFGHQMGDDCLKRFAQVLRANFRPGDTLIRYAGDEFIVIAPGMRPESLEPRIAAARVELGKAGADTPAIRFSVGLSFLEIDGDVDAAVAIADSAMYKQKQEKHLKSA
ncbi:GGDEF domain-containing protein [Massilia sp. DD77]|uniref:GGDEF domain-containing protein n=1 Tax=Massilia sp. DD77 TaxID=3109349 RepID=UPI003000335C